MISTASAPSCAIGRTSRFPQVRGDWTPYWEDGAGSSAHETAMKTNDHSKLPKISTAGGKMVFTFTGDQTSIDGTTTVVIDVGTTLNA